MSLKIKLLKFIGKIMPILFLVFVLIFIALFFISLIYIVNSQEIDIETFFQNLIITIIILIIIYFAYINLEPNSDISNLVTAGNLIWVITVGFMTAMVATIIFTFVLGFLY